MARERKARLWIEIGPNVLIDKIMEDCRELKRLLEAREMADLSSAEAVVHEQSKSKVARASTNTRVHEERNGQPKVAATEKPTIATKGIKRTRTRAGTYNATRHNLQSQISEESCVIYATTTCPMCTKAKITLKRMGAVFTTVELDRVDGAIKTELIAITGVTTVPQVFVGGEFIGGYNDGGIGGIVPLLKSGQLSALLIAAGAIPDKKVKSHATKKPKLRCTEGKCYLSE